MAIFRKWMTRNLTKTVEAVVEPAKETVKTTVDVIKKSAGDKVDLYSKIVILAVELFVGYKLISDHGEETRHLENRSAPLPGQIVINNYVSGAPEKGATENEHQ